MTTPPQKPIVKNQHYVPQCYLRHFTMPGSGQLAVLDKVRRKTFLADTRNVASERFFYDFEGDDVLSALGHQPMESFYCTVEGEMSHNWDVLVRNLDQHGGFSPADKQRMSLYIHEQLHRTPQFRRRLDSALQLMLLEDLRLKQAQGKFNPPDSLAHLTQDEWESSLGAMKNAPLNYVKYASERESEHRAVLEAMHWRLLQAPDGCSFITSDAPVQHVPGRLGEAAFVSLTYPVSPRYLLMVAPPLGTQAATTDCQVESTTADLVTGMNRNHLYTAEAQVYAPSTDWDALLGLAGQDVWEYVDSMPALRP